MTRKEKLKKGDQTLKRMVLEAETTPSSPPAPPVLTAPVIAWDAVQPDTVHFTADDQPPKWFWQMSFDGGVTWSDNDSGFNAITDAYNAMEESGTQMRACRADSSNHPYGPYSNVLTFP